MRAQCGPAFADAGRLFLGNLIGATMILANLLVDLSYAWIDPRLREGRR